MSLRDSPWRVFLVFLVFLRLGLTSFGGPVAHLGYFRTAFVQRLRWLDEPAYADLVALCQFLPGPGSSQVGMALGFARAGWTGALAAWLGFTLPSAALLILLAHGVSAVEGLAAAGALRGLKVVAVAVVAHAVWGMGRALCPDAPRRAMAVAAAVAMLALPAPWTQVLVLAGAALVGRLAFPAPPVTAAVSLHWPVSPRVGLTALATLIGLLLALPLWAALDGSVTATLIDGVFRAGALVFGGGHVVLPLLQASVVDGGAVSAADFVAGYGGAQAVPGPLFSFAAYLGAVAHWPWQGWRGGVVLTVAIFLPAFLVLVAALPFWQALRARPGVRAAMAGVNAAVVGILLAALIDPVWTSAIHGWRDVALAVVALALLGPGRTPPVAVVALAALAGQLLL